MNEKLFSIGKAAEIIGVSIQTLRNWDKSGKVKPDDLAKNGGRRYSYETLENVKKAMEPHLVTTLQEEDDLIKLAKRIKFIMSEFSLNIFTLSEKMSNFDNNEAEPQYIYDILHAKKVPNLKFLNDFADLFFINKAWLLDGSEKPFNRKFVEINDIVSNLSLMKPENYRKFIFDNQIVKTYLIVNKDDVKNGSTNGLLVIQNKNGNFQKISNQIYISEEFYDSADMNPLCMLYGIIEHITFMETNQENWDLINLGECFLKNILLSPNTTYYSSMLEALFDFKSPVDKYPKAIQESRKILEHFYKKD